MRDYVEKRNNGYYVAGSRVSLDSLVTEYNSGALPECMRQDFSSLSLEQIHGAITYYLANRAEVDTYVADQRKKWDFLERAAKPASGDLRERLEQARAISSGAGRL